MSIELLLGRHVLAIVHVAHCPANNVYDEGVPRAPNRIEQQSLHQYRAQNHPHKNCEKILKIKGIDESLMQLRSEDADSALLNIRQCVIQTCVIENSHAGNSRFLEKPKSQRRDKLNN